MGEEEVKEEPIYFVVLSAPDIIMFCIAEKVAGCDGCRMVAWVVQNPRLLRLPGLVDWILWFSGDTVLTASICFDYS